MKPQVPKSISVRRLSNKPSMQQLNFFTVSSGFAIVHPNNKLTINAVEAAPLESFSTEVRTAVSTCIISSDVCRPSETTSQRLRRSPLELVQKKSSSKLVSRRKCTKPSNTRSVPSRCFSLQASSIPIDVSNFQKSLARNLGAGSQGGMLHMNGDTSSEVVTLFYTLSQSLAG